MSVINKFWTILVTCSLLCASLVSAENTINVVDVAGRNVTIPQGAKRVILGESRMIYAIASIYGKHNNPFENIIGWKDDLEKFDPDAFTKYSRKFPEITKITNFGSPYQGDFNIEKAISIKTEVVIMNLQNLFKAQDTGMIEKLEKVGIATVFVDFRQRPTQNAIPSILLLGKIFNKQENVITFIDFYVQQMQKVYARVANKKDSERPLVLIENAAGSGWGSCCSTYGSNNMGRFVELAGARNWGSQFFGGLRGTINPEMVFKTDPDIIIGTGANWSKAKPNTKAVLLGYESRLDDINMQLSALAARSGWPSLQSVKNKKFYSIYHQFYNSPYHFIAIQQFAKWFYPKDFEDLDPKANFVELHDRFLPIEFSGHFWAALN